MKNVHDVRQFFLFPSETEVEILSLHHDCQSEINKKKMSEKYVYQTWVKW